MKDKIFYAIFGVVCGLLIGIPFGAWTIVIEIEKALW
jgi:Na+/glutamate symporter